MCCWVILQPLHLHYRSLSWIPAQLQSVRPLTQKGSCAGQLNTTVSPPPHPSGHGQQLWASLGSTAIFPPQDPAPLTPPQTTAVSAGPSEVVMITEQKQLQGRQEMVRGLCVLILLRADEGPGSPGGQQDATHCPGHRRETGALFILPTFPALLFSPEIPKSFSSSGI